jgi:P-type Ca2+ transporter type 2C
LGVDVRSGLDEAEARQRLAQLGPNRLHEERQEPIWESLFEALREPMILQLLVTGALYALWGEPADALVIFGVILAVVGVEIFNERRAERAITALRTLAEPTVLVRRGGRSTEVGAASLVPGDVILLQAGRRIPADARLVEAYGLAVDESPLTGESTPIEKAADLVLPGMIPLSERRNLVFAATTVTRGRGAAVVVATGMATELGRVASLAREVTAPPTPLQQAMRELSRALVWLALEFSVIVPVLGWLLAGQSLQQMLLTGLSLAFATIPEELPIIITMVLALGAYRLSQRRAIVKQLQAAETLGAVTVIATDKTGALTENRMTVTRLYPESLHHRLLEIGALCNDVAHTGEQVTGDPLHTALLQAAARAGVSVDTLRQTYRWRDEFTFDNERKLMSVVYKRGDAFWVVVKSAPEAILACSTRQWSASGEAPLTEADRQTVLTAAAQMGDEGKRVIALAEKTIPDRRLSQGEAEADLTFVGLAGLADPPRPEVKAAIMACHGAGVRPIMMTGDHPVTARAIAAQVDLDRDGRVVTGPELDALSDEALRETAGRGSLYARITPEHKLRIVRALQARDERVAVTGDGINDAPALVAANIGIAMLETGTDVARQAGDIVLADDNFATIVLAIEEGRLLFANLQKGIRYYLACKVALVSATFLPVLLRIPVPFTPIQIIVMELFMDLAASSTFVAEPAEADLMRRPPRDPKAPFMDWTMVRDIFSAAVGLFAAVAVSYLVTWY